MKKDIGDFKEFLTHANRAINSLDEMLDDESISDEDLVKIFGIIEYVKKGVAVAHDEFDKYYSE